MSEQNKPFVVTDRRKFTLDGTPRPDADPSPEPEPRENSTPPPAAAAPPPEPPLEFKSSGTAATPEPTTAEAPAPGAPDLPPPPTASEMEQANAAYQQTSERLDTAVRAATQEGQQPRVDLMGARQSIDMLSILSEKTRGNLTPAESQLMDNALFEVRMGFLEVTQALARSAANRTTAPGPGAPGFVPPGPKIVR
jgi:hypothetical protein